MLPTEIIVEILLRLPVQSLLRCRSVCKLWCSLISDPSFVKSHLSLVDSNYHDARHTLIYCMGRTIKTCHLRDVLCDNRINASEVDCPFKDPHKFAEVIGSCNGLLCVSLGNDNLFIWNPSTRMFNKLQYPAFHKQKRTQPWYGFGYDESTNDYKVVTIYYLSIDRTKYEVFIWIYSLKTGTWKRIDAFPNGIIPLNDFFQFSNGALHWLVRKGFGSSASRPIISLDLANETFGEVLQPKYDEGDKGLTLGALREWLCVICNYYGIRMHLWVMKVYGVKESWTKLFSIPCPTNPGTPLYLVPLWIINDGDILFQFGYKLFAYDTKNSSFLEIQNVGRYVEACTCVDSLVSPIPPAGLGDMF